MEAKLLTKIGLRVLAIYLIGLGFWLLPTYFSYIYNNIPPNSQTGDTSFYLQMIVSPALYGILLWFLAPHLAKLVVGKEAASAPTLENPAAWQIIGFTVLGAYFVVSNLSLLLGLSIEVMWKDAGSKGWMEGDYAALADHLTVAGARLLLGLVLMLAARNLSSWIRRFREAGLTPAAKE